MFKRPKRAGNGIGILLVAAFVGIGCILLAHNGPGSGPGALHDTIEAVGESFLVAVALAIVVDRSLKRRLANEVAKDVLLAVLGRHSPSWYVDYLLDSVERGLVAEACNWVIVLDSAREGAEYCSIGFAITYEGRNVSPQPVAWPELWLLGSADAAEEPSRFTSFSLRVGVDQQQAHEVIAMQYTGMTDGQRIEDGRTTLRLNPDIARVPEDVGYFRSELKGNLTLRSNDIFPIVTRFPTRATTIAIDDRREECSYRLQYQLRILECQSKVGTTRTHSVGDVLHPGSTVILRLGTNEPSQ
jgi:hypothetical protein